MVDTQVKTELNLFLKGAGSNRDFEKIPVANLEFPIDYIKEIKKCLYAYFLFTVTDANGFILVSTVTKTYFFGDAKEIPLKRVKYGRKFSDESVTNVLSFFNSKEAYESNYSVIQLANGELTIALKGSYVFVYTNFTLMPFSNLNGLSKVQSFLGCIFFLFYSLSLSGLLFCELYDQEKFIFHPSPMKPTSLLMVACLLVPLFSLFVVDAATSSATFSLSIPKTPTCPKNALYNASGGLCFCKKGYKINTNQTVCVKDMDYACRIKYAGSIYSTTKKVCTCPVGMKWKGKKCVVK